jgi:hypothetical protein
MIGCPLSFQSIFQVIEDWAFLKNEKIAITTSIYLFLSVKACCPSTSFDDQSSISSFGSPSPCPSPSPSPSRSSSPAIPAYGTSAGFASQIPSHDWRKFVIPWDKLPTEFMAACQKGKSPDPSNRREMVRIFAKEIKAVKNPPGRAALRTVAKRMVAKYPSSFENRLPNGIVVDNGVAGLMTSLENCIFNISRDKTYQKPLLKRLDTNSDAESQPVSKKMKKTLRDSYGCVNWQPGEFASGETDLTQGIKQEWLKNEHEKPLSEMDMQTVKEYMTSTYASQRLFLNAGNSSPTTSEAMKEWPFLFNLECMMGHFEELMGFGLEETLVKNLKDNAQDMCKFFQELRLSSKNKYLRECVKDMEKYSKEGSGEEQVRLVGVLLSLIAYFGEEEPVMFIYFEVPVRSFLIANSTFTVRYLANAQHLVIYTHHLLQTVQIRKAFLFKMH